MKPTVALIEPNFARCSVCEWEQTYDTQAEADRRKTVHEESHGIKAPVVERHLTGLSWQQAAVEAIKAVAARGQRFTINDALTEFGVSETPDRKAAHGRLAQLCHDQGICHPVDWQNSTRGTTKRSAVRVWTRSAAGCAECARKRTA
jgi:hypothetical protein